MRVLVVDDEVRFALSVQRGLRAEGFDADVAHDGERGLELAHPEAADAPDLVVGDLVVRPRARSATRGVAEIPLTAREFDLLEHLARADGRVVSKSELLAAVWGGMAHDDPNVVEVYAGYL